MSLDLPEPLRAWANAQVEAGRAADVDALAVAALEAMQGRQALIASEIDEAIAEADRDGWIDGEDFLREIGERVGALTAEADAHRGEASG